MSRLLTVSVALASLASFTSTAGEIPRETSWVLREQQTIEYRDASSSLELKAGDRFWLVCGDEHVSIRGPHGYIQIRPQSVLERKPEYHIGYLDKISGADGVSVRSEYLMRKLDALDGIPIEEALDSAYSDLRSDVAALREAMCSSYKQNRHLGIESAVDSCVSLLRSAEFVQDESIESTITVNREEPEAKIAFLVPGYMRTNQEFPCVEVARTKSDLAYSSYVMIHGVIDGLVSKGLRFRLDLSKGIAITVGDVR